MNFQQFLLEQYGKDYQEDFSKIDNELSDLEKQQSQLNFKDSILTIPNTFNISKELFNKKLYNLAFSRKLADMFVVFEFECYFPISSEKQPVLLNLGDKFNLEKVKQFFKIDILDNPIERSKGFKPWLEQLFEKNKDKFSKPDLIKEYIEDGTYVLLNDLFKRNKIVTSSLSESYLESLDPNYSYLQFITTFKPILKKEYRFTMDQEDNLETIIYIDDSSIKPAPGYFDYIKTVLLKNFKNTFFSKTGIDIKKPKSEINQQKWTLTEDESLSYINPEYCPIELISPRISYNNVAKALADIYKVFQSLSIITTVHTGFHVNIGFYSEQDLDLIKVVLLASDNKDLQDYNRLTNSFCKSQLDNLLETPFPEKTSDMLHTILDNQLVDFQEVISEKKMMAVNIKKWVYPFKGYKPLIEFRALGGVEYFSSKYQLTLDYIKKYCAVMAIATDPDLYKEQYFNKITLIRKQLEQKQEDIQRESIDYILELLASRTSKARVNQYEIDDLLKLYNDHISKPMVSKISEQELEWIATIKKSDKIKEMVLNKLQELDSKEFKFFRWLENQLSE